jgi:hypothetical protein
MPRPPRPAYKQPAKHVFQDFSLTHSLGSAGTKLVTGVFPTLPCIASQKRAWVYTGRKLGIREKEEQFARPRHRIATGPTIRSIGPVPRRS